jgi:predicted nucleic acid-binding protein
LSASPAVYLDTSALVKLVLAEAESAALAVELRRWQRHISSALVRTELVRACAPAGSAARRLAERVVADLDLLAIDDAILDAAAHLKPLKLRPLDAIHIASAQALGAALGGLIAYDTRLLHGAKAARLPTIVPR